MIIFIAGASGMFGSTLAPYLVSLGFTVIKHGNFAGQDVSCDLTNVADTHALLGKVRPDIIINLVAQTNVDNCEVNPHEAYLLNVRTVENLVSGIKDKNNSFFIQFSSDHLYDNIGPSIESEVRLTNVYALTKYAGELAAKSMPNTVLRTNFIGESLLDDRKSFSDWVIEKLENDSVITGFKDIIINPVSMTTLCSMVVLVIEKRIEGVFNLGSRMPMSKDEIIFEIADAYGYSKSNINCGLSTDYNFKAYRPKDMSMDCQKFEKAFDIELPYLNHEIHNLKRGVNVITK